MAMLSPLQPITQDYCHFALRQGGGAQPSRKAALSILYSCKAGGRGVTLALLRDRGGVIAAAE